MFLITKMDSKGFGSNEADSQLHFQSFAFDSADKTGPPPAYDDHIDASETAEPVFNPPQLLTGEEPARSRPSFWEFSYYQEFFDVDTSQVLNRIKWSMVPIMGRSTYLHRCVRPSPDLYGPFWICATLVFSIAVGGNISDYLHTAGKARNIWHYDFHKVSLAATTIYTYSFLVPLAIYGFLWYRKSSANYTLSEIICVYGYSMAIYVPVSILCVLQFWWLQWTLVILGSGLSGVVLLHTFWPAVKEDDKKIALGVMLVIIFLHVLVAVGFLAYFFQPNQNASSIEPATTVESIVTSVVSSISPKNLLVKNVYENLTDSNITIDVSEKM